MFFIFRILFLISFCLYFLEAKSPFTIENYETTAKSSTGSTAKNLAIKKARQEAFMILVEKFVDKEYWSHTQTETDDATINYLIDVMRISSEKITKKTYQAKLTFDFNKDRVEEHFRKLEVKFISPSGGKKMIVPVLSLGARSYLFDDENIWLKLWKNEPLHKTTFHVTLPIGDLQDVQALTTEDAVVGAGHKIKEFITRYGATDTLIIHATITKEVGKKTVEVSFQEFDKNGEPTRVKINTIRRAVENQNTSDEDELKQALNETLNVLQTAWKEAFFSESKTHVFFLKVSTPTLETFLSFKELIGKTNGVTSVQDLKFSKTFSAFKIESKIPISEILDDLNSKGYDVSNPVGWGHEFTQDPKLSKSDMKN